MKFSDFGERFNRFSGTTLLMDDLNTGLLQKDVVMLGGGNPAAIPKVVEQLEDTLAKLLYTGELTRALINYDGPQGNRVFLDTLAEYFNEHYQWGISHKNISLTHGSQSAFFIIFNSLAGATASKRQHVLLPITPEYIGYGDVGVEDDLFVSHEPSIEILSDGLFKYHPDFDALDINEQTGLICLSRPTNPSGNVLTDEECRKLDRMAQNNNVPLLLDNAYGTPFPHIIFNEVTPFWNNNTIVCLSLSKLGLPGVRTGIVIANEDVIQQLSNMTAITSLAPGGAGPVIVNELIRSRQLTALCDDVIRPFYQARSKLALKWLQQAVNDSRMHIHIPEGAIFLWIWFEGLPITTSELYEELKKNGLLIVPGRYFFPGQPAAGDHAESCIRMNYVQDEQDLQKGIEILASTLKKIW